MKKPHSIPLKITIGGHTVVYEIWRTNAPAELDGFGTFTLSTNGADQVRNEDRGRRPELERVVAIDQNHVDWQGMRYTTALYTMIEMDVSRSVMMHLENIAWSRINGSFEG